jgi:putative spermidine/putrescine transport system permease protein
VRTLGLVGGKDHLSPASLRPLRNRALLLSLPLLALLVLFILPIVNLVAASGNLQTYVRVLQVPVHWEILWNTFLFALKVTATTLLISYPLAAFARMSPPRVAGFVIVCSTIPMWTSLLARTYAWLIILERHGIVNASLRAAGLIERPVLLMHNSIGATLGSIYIMMPLMVLALDASMRSIDMTVVRAARTLGARPMQAFVRVFVPQSFPGVVSGCLLVFILSLGFFVTPALLGGPHDRVFSMLIVQQINRSGDFEAAAALSLLFLAAAVVVLAAVGAVVASISSSAAAVGSSASHRNPGRW